MSRLTPTTRLAFCISFLASSASSSDLALYAHKGRMIHDAFYLERPTSWPQDWPWYGDGLNEGYSYRYAPALMRQDDELHYWGCSEGGDGFGDYIRYKKSTDGGATWTSSVIALSPTKNSEDGWAVCDPSVVYFGGYYYMAYTATNHSGGGGYPNHVFIARSTSPDGDFKKWNGNRWGGTPKAIRYFNGSHQYWGYGEPELVIKGNTLFLYYSEFIDTSRTKVATADLTQSDWPNAFVNKGYAIKNRDSGEDQSNVRYLPEVDLFIAVGIANRFSINSYLHVWYSEDGLKFIPLKDDNIRTNIQITAHNAGISGNKLGHARMGTHEYVAYAYQGPNGYWGKWNTWMNPIRLSGPAKLYPFEQPEPDTSEDDLVDDDILMLIIPLLSK